MDSIWHPYTKFSSIAEGGLPVITRGEGIYLYDDEGNRYVDAISSWWACTLGHSHPRILEAIRRQAGVLQHSILGNLSHPAARTLAERLADLCGGRRHVHFASDGASAIEAALKIAVQYWDNLGVPNRHGFLSLTDPYHGDTLGAVSVGYIEHFHRPFKPILFRTIRVATPDCRGCRYGRATPDCEAPCFAETEETIRSHADELAAVVVEPLCQGAAGMKMYGAGYLRRLADLCRELKVLLVIDEIAMGFCKTGKMFGYQHAGVDPDIVCVGKALSAGTLPISAAIVRDEIYETFSDVPEDHTFYHGHTFAGNPIAAAAAIEALSVYEEESLCERAAEIGALWDEQLGPLGSHPHVREVRTLGAIAAVEFDPSVHDPAGRPMAAAVQQRLRAAGVLTRPLGPVIYLIPPLILDDQQAADLARALYSAVEEAR